jgi:hypothetical protein
MRNINTFDVPKEFKTWLIETNRLSPKAAGDIVSRLRRISNHIEVNIETAISSEESFIVLLKQIKSYSINHSTSKNSAYTLSATLKSALRKYAIFRHPKNAKKYLNLYIK